MKKQVCSSLLTLSMTASILSPAAMAAEISVPDDNQNAIAVVSDTGSSSANNGITVNPEDMEEVTFGDIESDTLDLSENSENSDEEESTESGFKYSPISEDQTGYKEIMINGYEGSATEVVIPATIDGNPVIAINNNAFQNNTKVTSVTIPKGVIAIGERAFAGCTSMTSITIPNSVEQIGSAAFASCTKLVSVTLPNRLDSIAEHMFYGCEALTEVTIPRSVTSIEDQVFANNYLLQKISFGCMESEWSNITLKGDNTFLKERKDDNRITFKGRQSDDYIYEVDGNQVSIDRYIGSDTKVAIPETLDGKKVTSIGYEAFCETDVVEVTIPEGVTSINGSAFLSCDELTSVTLPSSLNTIEDFAFDDCNSLKSITIPDGVTSIDRGAFEGCEELASVTLPDGVKTIGSYAFCECNKLKSITIPKGVETVGKWAFNSCEALESVTISEGVKSIKHSAFAGCSSLKQVTISEGVMNISAYAFFYCPELTSVTIGNGLETIDQYVFAVCDKLTQITIPKSVKTVKQYAFAKMDNSDDSIKLTVTYGGTEADWNKIAIDNTKDGNQRLLDATKNYAKEESGPYSYEVDEETNEVCITKYNSATDTGAAIPSEIDGKPVTSIGANAFSGCDKLTWVSIPKSVKSIGEGAFKDCAKLEDVYYSGTEEERNANLTIVEEGNAPFAKQATFHYQSVRTGDFIYQIEDDSKVTIVGYVGTKTTVEIPETLDERTITGIGAKAFQGCADIKSVTIPESVTSIGAYAFSMCTGLTTVILPESLTSIGESAFDNCTKLASVTIPDGVQSISESAFAECDALSSVVLGSGVKSIAKNAFKCSISLKTLTIPDGVESIGEAAFAASGLTSIAIPDSVESIGKSAFASSEGLASVELGSGVKSIAQSTFASCTSLEKITIPDGVESIGEAAFAGDKNLTSVTLPDSLQSIGDGAFDECVSLTSISIPSKVTEIGEAAFSSCEKIEEIMIPDGVTSIKQGTFAGCTSLKKVTIPASVESIGERAFDGCTSLETVNYGSTKTAWDSLTSEIGEGNDALTGAKTINYQYGDYTYQVNAKNEVTITKYNGEGTEVEIPAELDGRKVTSIGAEAFMKNKTITTVTVGSNVKSIGDGVFSGCSNLTTVILPDGVESIGTGAFDSSGLQSIEFPNSVKSIGDAAFGTCNNLTSITIPNQMTTIGTAMFAMCSNLTTVTIPKSVKTIQTNAFINTGVQTVNYGGTKTEWNQIDFTSNNQALTDASTINYQYGDYTYQVNAKNEVTIARYNGKDEKVEIPSELDGCKVTTIGAEAFKGCDTLKDITIPNSVTSIGKNAFSGCTALEKAYYDDYEERWNQDVEVQEGNEPLTKVLTYKSKIICKGSEQVKISKGTHEMRIHGQSYGKYTFTWNEEQAGWTVQNSEGQYLSFADGELVLSDEPFVWHYDAKLYTTTEEKVQHNFWWWNYTTTKTVYWYLTGDGENLTISKSDKEADLALYDAVEATEHSFGDWVSDGNGTGTHSRTCTVCNKTETEDCTYGEDGYCTVCGAINPEKASVSVTAEVTKHTTRTGWWWWCRPTTTWTANITATGEGVDVATVEYSLDGEAYETGTTFTSKEEITTFYIRVTDSKDNVTNWTYADGEVTQVTEQGSDSDFSGGE